MQNIVGFYLGAREDYSSASFLLFCREFCDACGKIPFWETLPWLVPKRLISKKLFGQIPLIGGR